MNDLLPSASKQTNPVASLKLKLIQLRDSLNSFLDMPPNIPWPIVLGQFNSLISKYESITNDLQVLPFKQILVVPQRLPPNDPDSVPRVTLRTRLDQELIDTEEKLLSAHALVNKLAPERATNVLDQAPLRNELRGWVALVDSHDAVANHAINHLDSIMEETIKELKKRLPEEGEEGNGPTSEQLQKNLEETVRWISLGNESKPVNKPL